MVRSRIAVLGCGPGHPDWVTPVVRERMEEADVLIGAARLLALAGNPEAERIALGASHEDALVAVAAAREAGKRVAVLVSGDPGVYSLAACVVERFGAEACEVVPGISAVQVACARLGCSWTEARIVSAHGRVPTTSAEALTGWPVILILGGGGESRAWIERTITALAQTHAVWIGRDLTLPGEHVGWLNPDDALGVLAMELGRPRTILALVRRAVADTPHDPA